MKLEDPGRPPRPNSSIMHSPKTLYNTYEGPDAAQAAGALKYERPPSSRLIHKLGAPRANATAWPFDPVV
jgi:hypothetical protein